MHNFIIWFLVNRRNLTKIPSGGGSAPTTKPAQDYKKKKKLLCATSVVYSFAQKMSFYKMYKK